MSNLTEAIADDLAQKALAAETETGDDTIADQVSKAIGVASPTFQEMFNTAVRMRRAEATGLKAIATAVRKATAAADAAAGGDGAGASGQGAGGQGGAA